MAKEYCLVSILAGLILFLVFRPCLTEGTKESNGFYHAAMRAIPFLIMYSGFPVWYAAEPPWLALPPALLIILIGFFLAFPDRPKTKHPKKVLILYPGMDGALDALKENSDWDGLAVLFLACLVAGFVIFFCLKELNRLGRAEKR